MWLCKVHHNEKAQMAIIHSRSRSRFAVRTGIAMWKKAKLQLLQKNQVKNFRKFSTWNHCWHKNANSWQSSWWSVFFSASTRNYSLSEIMKAKLLLQRKNHLKCTAKEKRDWQKRQNLREDASCPFFRRKNISFGLNSKNKRIGGLKRTNACKDDLKITIWEFIRAFLEILSHVMQTQFELRRTY